MDTNCIWHRSLLLIEASDKLENNNKLERNIQHKIIPVFQDSDFDFSLETNSKRLCYSCNLVLASRQHKGTACNWNFYHWPGIQMPWCDIPMSTSERNPGGSSQVQKTYSEWGTGMSWVSGMLIQVPTMEASDKPGVDTTSGFPSAEHLSYSGLVHSMWNQTWWSWSRLIAGIGICVFII